MKVPLIVSENFLYRKLWWEFIYLFYHLCDLPCANFYVIIFE